GCAKCRSKKQPLNGPSPPWAILSEEKHSKEEIMTFSPTEGGDQDATENAAPGTSCLYPGDPGPVGRLWRQEKEEVCSTAASATSTGQARRARLHADGRA